MSLEKWVGVYLCVHEYVIWIKNILRLGILFVNLFVHIHNHLYACMCVLSMCVCVCELVRGSVYGDRYICVCVSYVCV